MPKRIWTNPKKVERARRSIIKDVLRGADGKQLRQENIRNVLQEANRLLPGKLVNTKEMRLFSRMTRAASHTAAKESFIQAHFHRNPERKAARIDADLQQYGKYRYDIAPGEKKKTRHLQETVLRKLKHYEEKRVQKARNARNN
ncbi:MAG: hypothetical protein Q7R70_03830 [Candidatus Diapherotrites archaeon]|nr:hypothetical protein [Candidatus Diapherotrites archaeon]